MFRRDVRPIDSLMAQFLRASGLETPLLQRRLVNAWPEVAGEVIARYTGGVFLDNQTLNVKINNAALRAELSMMRSEYVRRLNDHVGVWLISDIRFR